MTSLSSAPESLRLVLQDIADERMRQLAKHGDQSHLPDGTGPSLQLAKLPVWVKHEWGNMTPSVAALASEIGELDPKEDTYWEAYAHDLADWAKARCKAASQNEGGNGTITYEQILTEEWAEVVAEQDPEKLKKELIQLATVCVAWVEKLNNG